MMIIRILKIMLWLRIYMQKIVNTYPWIPKSNIQNLKKKNAGMLF